MSNTSIHFTKGHGTGNDFVLIDDAEAALDITPGYVQWLADRHLGIGGDGIIRIVRSRALDDPAAARAAADGAEWFMDYSNADGSVAEMCGNGVRVFAHYLYAHGLATTETLRVGTRDGVKIVRRVDIAYPGDDADWFSVDMGTWTISDEAGRHDGTDSLVRVSGLEVPRPALTVDMGNPHAVVALAELSELSELDLYHAPSVDPVPSDGINVEFIVPGQLDEEHGSVTMRVHERGVGETQSCGTGACAAALAARLWAGSGAPDVWRVDVPGGTLQVRVDGERVHLAGPAELVADGTVAFR
ncbi:diaminopimelate epimerase [Spelaeicoccus albus]|uniref:Diaminopimelate epimerase n=1 Tax=Spelaeicoccus albus TaxID=1280376 RepID=A0A7Z0D2T0_9MICO|nr:diaminopimelate epimerase [Spelaeicoccus albus]NYI67826.1 diaminopimelate epimerase [Spelaeicoccus albus]